MKYITSSKEGDARRLIEWLLANRNPSGGWPMDFVTPVAIAELASTSRMRLSDGEVMQALSEMHRKGLSTVSAFDDQVDAIRSSRINKAPPKPYRFYLPLVVSLGEGLKTPFALDVMGYRFTFTSKRSAANRLGVKELSPAYLQSRVPMLRAKAVPDVLIGVTAVGKTWGGAWSGAQPAFDTCRGILELALGYGGWKTNSHPQPLVSIPHPAWILGKAPKEPVDGAWFVVDDFSPTFPSKLTRNRLHFVRPLLEALRSHPAKGTTDELLGEATRLYAQALDARFPHHSLLGLWQLAEAITRSETVGGATEQVRKRLEWHAVKGGFVEPGMRNLLEDIAKKRNDIVHRGLHALGRDDVNHLKTLCELGLAWLLSIRQELPTVLDLDQFYRLRQVGKAEQSAAIRALALLSS